MFYSKCSSFTNRAFVAPCSGPSTAVPFLTFTHLDESEPDGKRSKGRVWRRSWLVGVDLKRSSEEVKGTYLDIFVHGVVEALIQGRREPYLWTKKKPSPKGDNDGGLTPAASDFPKFFSVASHGPVVVHIQCFLWSQFIEN